MLDHGSMCQLYEAERKQSPEWLSEAVTATSGITKFIANFAGHTVRHR